MKVDNVYSGFEQGAIRPPSEAKSLLIRITRNCPWNHCTFCPVYKNKKFSLRPLDHVLKDIDIVNFYVNKLVEIIDKQTKISVEKLEKLLPDTNNTNVRAIHAAFNFISGGMKSIFLQDGNSLIIKPKNMIKILLYIKKSFPTVERITSYARSRTIAKITDNDLDKIAKAGLSRIHIGMESGSDKILKKIKKGVTKEIQIIAGQKVKRVGIQLSEYYMPGLGGKLLSKENALETADAINQINPDFIRLRTLAISNSTPLGKDFENRIFNKIGEEDTIKELLVFLNKLNNIDSVIKSDHTLNLFTEFSGKLPKDKPKMINLLQSFLNLDSKEKMIFCIGKRTGIMNNLKDLRDVSKYNNALEMCLKLKVNTSNIDEVITSIMQRFV